MFGETIYQCKFCFRILNNFNKISSLIAEFTQLAVEKVKRYTKIITLLLHPCKFFVNIGGRVICQIIDAAPVHCLIHF
jgi:hypothetical protein